MNANNLSAQIKEALKTSTVEPIGDNRAGRVNEAQIVKIDDDKRIFIKMNKKAQAHILFAGEFAALEAIYNTNTVRVPKPLAVVERPKAQGGGAGLVMEYINFRALDVYQGTMGEKLAQLHLYNGKIHEQADNKFITSRTPSPATPTRSRTGHKSPLPPIKPTNFVAKFGFHCPTFSGFLAQGNHWEKDWVVFLAKRVIQPQIEMLQYKYDEKEAGELWAQIHPKLPYFFRNLTIVPSLLHGHFWFGNTAEDDNGPLMYDPASFFGHHEYDLALCNQYGGFNKSFFNNYRHYIPKEKGFEERAEIYKLSHYLHNWNHYGDPSKQTAIFCLRAIAKRCESIQ